MKYSQAEQGRIFVIRLEDGDVIHEAVEKLAEQEAVRAGMLIAVGGVDKGTRLVVGPEDGRSKKITPMEHVLKNVHEIAGTGTLFPDKDGKPVLHMHIACGREESTVTGCVRNGVKAWHVLEVILVELIDTSAVRLHEDATGFELLQP